MYKIIQNRNVVAILTLLFVCGIAWVVSAGNLYPPAPPSSTMKTLEEIHTAVQALRGAAPTVAIPVSTSDVFLQVSGIPGDSLDLRHPNWIDLRGYMMNVANGAEVGGKPKPLFSGVYFSKNLDSTSVPLKLKCCNNEPVELITLEIAKAGAMQEVYYRLRLWNARVAFVEPFSESNGGLEVVAFTDFTKIEWSFKTPGQTEWQIQQWDITKQGGES